MLHITIVGMGLIGTSLGMALRSANRMESPLGPTTIMGYDRDSRATATAWAQQAIDRQARDLKEALYRAELVILAIPAQALPELFAAMAPLLASGSVITDVISTKVQVLEWAHTLLPETVDFVGGHPMAGKEQSGAAAAEAGLFKGALYCLTPSPQACQEAIQLVEGMVRQVGATPYYIDPHEHDMYVAGVSHLPFLLSTLLVEVTSHNSNWHAMAHLAATGFRDISRLASGDPEMHRDICITNRAAITHWVGEMITLLCDVHKQLERDEGEELLALFDRARTARNHWLATRHARRPDATVFDLQYQDYLRAP
jgi:prephenate dehydrogenase